MIAVNFLYLYALAPRLRDRHEVCAPDELAACGTADRVSRAVPSVSVGAKKNPLVRRHRRVARSISIRSRQSQASMSRDFLK